MRRIAGGVLLGSVLAAAAARAMSTPRGDEESDEVELVGVLGGSELRSRARGFRGGSALAWYGGVALDLREATLAPVARLRLRAILGGIAIRVPAGVRVESGLRSLAGGVAVDGPEPDDPEAPVLHVEGFALLGGIAVGGRRARP